MKHKKVIRDLPHAHRPWLAGTAPAVPVRTCDPPERVNACLNCTRPKCNNCFGNGVRKKELPYVHEL